MDPNLAKALVAVQADLRNPGFDKVNTAFGAPRGYASLASHVDALRLPLAKHGLAVVQLVGTGADGRLTLTTILTHSSGESIESHVSVPMPATEQKVGSSLTYLRRYALAAIVGVCGDEDDDGNVASAPTVAQAPRAKAALEAAVERREIPDTELAERLEAKRRSQAVEGALVGKPRKPAANTVSVFGTVSKVYENPLKSGGFVFKIQLEEGQKLTAWEDLPGVNLIAVGKRYEFRCSLKDGKFGPEHTIKDFIETASPSDAGEEIPF